MNHEISHTRLAVILAMTMALAPLAVDTYLPAFPDIADSLYVSVHDVSLSIAVYVFMLAVGQLVAGPLSDKFGRSVVMTTGLGVFSISSLLLSQASDLTELFVLRGLQAFGGGWAMVCVPALVRDRLSGQEAARFFSLIGLMTIIAPAIAPAFGSFLLLQWGWPSIFLFLGGYSTVMVLLLRLLVFRGSSPQKNAAEVMGVLTRYRQVFAVKPALRFMFLQTFAFAVMLLFITHAAFIYQDHFGVGPARFSVLFGANIVVMLAMNFTNRALLKRIQSVRILRWAVTMQAVGVVLLILVTVLQPRLWLFLPAMMITVGAMGAISSNTQACFMEFFPQHSGTAAALLGATQFAVGGLVAGASSLLPETILSVVIVQALCSLICLVLIWGKAAQPE